MLGNDHVLLTLTDFLVGILFGFVKNAHLLAAFKDDLALFAFLPIDHLFVVGELLLRACQFFLKHSNDGFVGDLFFGRKGRLIRNELLFCAVVP